MSVGWLEQQRNMAKQRAEEPLSEVLLPQTDEQLIGFTAEIISRFQLPNNEMTELTIYQAVYNMPNGQAIVKPQDIANQVRKSIANDVVGRKLSAYHLRRKEEAQAAALAAKQAETKTEVSDGTDKPV